MYLRNENVSIQSQFTAYLLKSIRKTKAQFQQKQCIQSHLSLDESYLLNESGSDSDLLDNLSLSFLDLVDNDKLLNVLLHLNNRDRTILTMRYIEGYPLTIIVTKLKIPYSTAKTACRRAVKKIREGIDYGL